jgi:hypothetical protein
MHPGVTSRPNPTEEAIQEYLRKFKTSFSISQAIHLRDCAGSFDEKSEVNNLVIQFI